MTQKTSNPNQPSAEQDIQLVCKLTDKEKAQRKNNLQKKLFNNLEEVHELEDGFALRFPGEEATLLDQIFKHTKIEWECCPFFRFSIAIEANHGPVWLELGGSESIKEQLRTEMEQLQKTS